MFFLVYTEADNRSFGVCFPYVVLIIFFVDLFFARKRVTKAGDLAGLEGDRSHAMPSVLSASGIILVTLSLTANSGRRARSFKAPVGNTASGKHRLTFS